MTMSWTRPGGEIIDFVPRRAMILLSKFMPGRTNLHAGWYVGKTRGYRTDQHCGKEPEARGGPAIGGAELRGPGPDRGAHPAHRGSGQYQARGPDPAPGRPPGAGYRLRDGRCLVHGHRPVQ